MNVFRKTFFNSYSTVDSRQYAADSSLDIVQVNSIDLCVQLSKQKWMVDIEKWTVDRRQGF